MTTPTFDLTREPWIPCETASGSRVLLGFEDVLLRADELLAVHDESPLVNAMLHRLLLACLHQIVDGPRSLKDWAAIWRAPRFDERRIRAYFDRWRPRFDLFHAERPFLQVAGLFGKLSEGRAGKEPAVIPMRRLPIEASTYSGAVHLLEHGGEAEDATPGAAARAMLGLLGFGAGGRISNTADSAPGCPLRPGSVALAVGSSLRETLTLNLLVRSKDRPVPDSGADRAAWEADEAARYGERPVLGWVDALTWQARRVELLHDGLRVRGAVSAGGEVGQWVEPMHCFDVRDEKKGPMAVKFMPDRVGFRDALALYQALDASGARRPAVCSQLAQLVAEDVLDASMSWQLLLLGVSSDQASIRLSRAERVPLPAPLLVDQARLDVLRAAIEAAEGVEGALRKADYRLATCALDLGDRGPDKKDVGALVTRLGDRPHYWRRLAKAFPALARGVAHEDPAAARAAFEREAIHAARAALKHAADQIGDGARAHRARALAERTLQNELRELFPQPEVTGAQT